jgi:hypothetical protein
MGVGPKYLRRLTAPNVYWNIRAVHTLALGLYGVNSSHVRLDGRHNIHRHNYQ